MKFLALLSLVAVCCASAEAAQPAPDVAPPSGGGVYPIGVCIGPAERARVDAVLGAHQQAAPLETQGVLYTDPMSGGTNSIGREIINYLDLDPTSNLQDYRCGTTTYDGHHGIDIQIPSFYDMDEGIPIRCASPGTVIYTHDGEFDRWTFWDNSAIANAVIVQHPDGSEALYWHMRKGSVAVIPGQQVTNGDVLGLVGSSGFSSGPHLHFETQSGGAVEPDSGSCQNGPWWWANPPAYSPTLFFACFANGVTTLTPDWATILESPPSKTHVKTGQLVNSWVRLRNVQTPDIYTWKWYRNNVLQTTSTVQFAPAVSSLYYQSKNMTSSAFAGSWRVEIARNGIIFATQFFTVDTNVNLLPTIAPQTFTVNQDTYSAGVFQGTDPDGSVFWYRLDSGPFHGTLTQDGGRARKFRYVPDAGFVGRDSVTVHAVDDENAVGPTSQYTFEVQATSGVAEGWGDDARGARLRAPFPNPMPGGGELSYVLPASARVRLTIHDVAGRLVRVLDAGERTAGEHRARWDGHDAGGQPLTAGIYFARLSAGAWTDVRTVVLAR